jgi:hypothetical protein
VAELQLLRLLRLLRLLLRTVWDEPVQRRWQHM